MHADNGRRVHRFTDLLADMLPNAKLTDSITHRIIKEYGKC